MANVHVRLGYKTAAWFTANATRVLKEGQPVFLNSTGQYKIGDGVTQLSVLSFYGGSSATWGSITGTLSNQLDLQAALDAKVTKNANITGATKTKITYDAKGLVTAGADATTDDISEGATNLYYTNARADARITLQKGAANGIAPLDGSSKIPTSYLPALALTDVFVVGSQAAQLALTAEEGDVAVRTDQNKSYIHNGGSAGTMADWQELLTPTDSVLSVNGFTGAVTLTTSDIAEGTNLYYTNARVNTQVATYTGDVTLSGTTFSIGALKVTNAMIAASTIDLTAKVTGTLPATNGGTGTATVTTGDLLYGSASNVWSKLASGATAGMYLRSAGASTAPVWSTLILPNAVTANNIVYATATNTYGQSNNFKYDGTSLIIGDGTGVFGGPTIFSGLNSNATNQFIVYQQTSGTAARTRFFCQAGARSANVFCFSEGYTTAGYYIAGTTLVEAIAGGLGLATNGAFSVNIYTNNSSSQKVEISAAGNVVLGSQAALATNATDGFTYIPTCAGAPTGAPTAYTGKTAMIYDTTNNKLMVYNGAWRGIALT